REAPRGLAAREAAPIWRFSHLIAKSFTRGDRTRGRGPARAAVTSAMELSHNPRPSLASGFSEVRTVVKPLPRLQLQGFNNLTKALSFNIYDICYAVSEEQRQRYIEYIDEAYDSDRLTKILTDVADIIGANILNIARQDYDPQGASVTILISEHPIVEKLGRDMISEAVVAHLDKSHITVHTYPQT